MEPKVKSFLAIHQDLFRLKSRKGFSLEDVDSLIVVDANNWKRLDQMESLTGKKDLEIICWDHHMEGDTIGGTQVHRQEVGATIALLVEEMERQDTAFLPMHATLFLLGIYSDTGCLCFSSVTARDARMVSFLLDNGADLNLVSAYLTDTVDDAHSKVFSDMLASAMILEIEGLKIGCCVQPVKSGLTMLANLVTKYKDFKGLDAAIVVFPTDLGKWMIIGRSSSPGFDVGLIMRTLGGGGHGGAGSAVVKGVDIDELKKKIVTLIQTASRKDVLAESIMSDPKGFKADTDLTMAQAAKLLSQRNEIALLVCEKNAFLGT